MLVQIEQEEYDNLIEQINMLQELVAELSKEKESEAFKPISEYTIDDWQQALKEGWVFCQRNGDLTNIMSVDSDPLTEYPVESESCWLRLNGQELFGGKYNLDIVARIK